MFAIANEHGKITISFLASDLPVQEVEECILFFNMEFWARQSRLPDQAAFSLSDQIKTDWSESY